MSEELLKRLVETLESIDGRLSEIAISLDGIDRNLNGCMSRYGNNSFLCIAGDISTN